MDHDCVKRVNEGLAEHNTQIMPAFSLGADVKELISIETMKLDSKVRGKARKLFATFCPFCGKKLKGMG